MSSPVVKVHNIKENIQYSLVLVELSPNKKKNKKTKNKSIEKQVWNNLEFRTVSLI